MDTLELILPTWMASALVNGDTTALSLEDDDGAESEAKLDAVSEWLAGQGYSGTPIEVEDLGFYNNPSLDSALAYGEKLGGDFSKFVFPKIK